MKAQVRVSSRVLDQYRHAVAVLVVGWRKGAVVREVQDHGTRLADSRESARSHYLRFRARYRQPARHGKLKGSAVERILKEAGGVFGDKGFIGTDYITTPIRKPECRELLQWEHEWNNQVSSFRAPVERAVAALKTWRILFTDYRRPLKTFKSSFRAAVGLYFFKESFA
jgi:hypothetical protein